MTQITRDQWKKGYHPLDNEWWLADYAVKRDFKISKEKLLKLQLRGEVEARGMPSYYGVYNVYRLADLERLIKSGV